MEATIIYYSSNREKPEFENKVVETLLASNGGRREIVSVTQKPMDLGKNICVGMQDQCYANEFRQIQIALNAVTTPYIIIAESDTLYPPDYFNFDPPEMGRCYRYPNVWVHYTQFNGKPRYWFKKVSDCAQMIDRELWLSVINPVMDARPEWSKAEDIGVPPMQFRDKGGPYMTMGDPVVTVKTRQGVKSNTRTKGGFAPKFDLPYWGKASGIREKYLPFITKPE